MTRDRRYFIGIDETITGKVRLGDNSRIDIKGKGTISFVDQDGEKRTMCDVYFIPKLKSNIVSLGKVTELGYDVRMKGRDLIIHDQEGKQVVKTRRSKNRLYKIRMRLPEMTPEHKLGQTDVINMSKNSGEIFSENSTHIERPRKWNHLISSSHEEVMNFTKQMFLRSPVSDLCALFGMKRINENEIGCKLGWYGIWVHNRRFEKWIHVKSRSYERVMGSTNQPTSDFADLDQSDLFGEPRLEQKELGYKPNFHGILTHQGRSETWNHIKRRSHEGVMNFSSKCFLDLSISEIEQFKGNRVCAWQLVESLHKKYIRRMKCSMDSWSMRIEAYRVNDPRRKKIVVEFAENEACKWDELHEVDIGDLGRVEEKRGEGETEDVEVMVEENPERSRSKYLNNDVLFVEYVGLLCSKNEKLRNRDETEALFEDDKRDGEDENRDRAEAKFEDEDDKRDGEDENRDRAEAKFEDKDDKRDGEDENRDEAKGFEIWTESMESEKWTKAKGEELRNHERAEESEEWTKTFESEEWTKTIESEEWTEWFCKVKRNADEALARIKLEEMRDPIGIEDIEEVNFKLKGENVGVSFKLT